ncbi:hypothetical protein [Pseudomonas aeruginosa]|uniref:hypothetical protein n=1 Tax=Pseudomonas aeruginosa TaxID=287 RepID=UPI0022BA2192|nr:hypothetical protein [Pseudomonas aeruginosa]WBJ79662.1 hypothetical protein PALA50_05618 [Pseudomonas aeruginosa]HCF4373737.1 hypothetical protein [Pseudomonas aeruginosa]
MDYDRELEKHFFGYLLSIGYPKESIYYQPAIKPVRRMLCYRPSFALIDPNKNEYLAIIEVKEARIDSGKSIYENMIDYRKALGANSIPVYIISTDYDNPSSFLLHSFDDQGNIKVIDCNLFPTFEALSAKETTDRKAELRVRREDTDDKFTRVCWLVAAGLFVLVIADFIGKEMYGLGFLTAERITLIGAALALIVIPFAQKFKGLGIEWEKVSGSRKLDDD